MNAILYANSPIKSLNPSLVIGMVFPLQVAETVVKHLAIPLKGMKSSSPFAGESYSLAWVNAIILKLKLLMICLIIEIN